MSRTFSGCVSSADPIPPCSENLTGQPMLTSIARTSSATTRAARSASAASAVPSWKATRSCGFVEKISCGRELSLPGRTNSIVLSAALTRRVHELTERSTSSTEYTMCAPCSAASSRNGSVFTRTIGASRSGAGVPV